MTDAACGVHESRVVHADVGAAAPKCPSSPKCGTCRSIMGAQHTICVCWPASERISLFQSNDRLQHRQQCIPLHWLQSIGMRPTHPGMPYGLAASALSSYHDSSSMHVCQLDYMDCPTAHASSSLSQQAHKLAKHILHAVLVL